MRFYVKVTLVRLVMLCITTTPRQGGKPSIPYLLKNAGIAWMYIATEPQEHYCYSTYDNGSSYTGSQPIVVEVALDPGCISDNHCECELDSSSQFDCLYRTRVRPRH